MALPRIYYYFMYVFMFLRAEERGGTLMYAIVYTLCQYACKKLPLLPHLPRSSPFYEVRSLPSLILPYTQHGTHPSPLFYAVILYQCSFVTFMPSFPFLHYPRCF